MLIEFNSINELLHRVKTDTGKGSHVQKDRFFSNECTKDWGGVKGEHEYNDLLTNGWKEAVNLLNLRPLMNEGSAFNLVPSISGIFYDVAKFVQGESECMADFEAAEVNNYLSINIDGITPSSMTGRELAIKCKAIIDAVNTLELNRTRCHITLSTAAKEKYGKTEKHTEIQLKVKDYEETLIPEHHGLIIGNLGTIRGLMYAYLSIHVRHKSLGKCTPSTKNADVTLSLWKDSPEAITQKLTIN